MSDDRQGLWRPVIVAGAVTLLINAAGVAINYFLIDRVRLDIEQSNLELSRLRQATEDVKVGIEKERVVLERTRTGTDIDRSKIEQARLADERMKNRADVTRLTTQFLTDLQPVAKVKCSAVWKKNGQIEIPCTVSNNGSHSFQFPAPEITILTQDDRISFPSESFEFLHPEGNKLLAQSSVDITYELFINKDWTIKMPSPLILQLVFKMQTDPELIRISQRESFSHVSAADIEKRSKLTYTFRVGGLTRP